MKVIIGKSVLNPLKLKKILIFINSLMNQGVISEFRNGKYQFLI